MRDAADIVSGSHCACFLRWFGQRPLEVCQHLGVALRFYRAGPTRSRSLAEVEDVLRQSLGDGLAVALIYLDTDGLASVVLCCDKR